MSRGRQAGVAQAVGDRPGEQLAVAAGGERGPLGDEHAAASTIDTTPAVTAGEEVSMASTNTIRQPSWRGAAASPQARGWRVKPFALLTVVEPQPIEQSNGPSMLPAPRLPRPPAARRLSLPEDAALAQSPPCGSSTAVRDSGVRGPRAA